MTPGARVGHWTHPAGTTGVTVVWFPDRARGGVWIPGGSTGTRELGPLDPSQLADQLDALCLAGGSAFGLGAADGVMAGLVARGQGHPTAAGVVPIVPAAILYDLDAGPFRPDAAAGREAFEAAVRGDPVREGAVGAGAGARVGRAGPARAPGGIGLATGEVGGVGLAALVAVNAVGAVVDPRTGAVVAGAPGVVDPLPRGATTLVVVVTDAPLDRAAATGLARMGSAGLARALRPAFTPFDGDVVFAASTGPGPSAPPGALLALGDHAAELVAEAVLRAVHAAAGPVGPRGPRRAG